MLMLPAPEEPLSVAREELTTRTSTHERQPRTEPGQTRSLIRALLIENGGNLRASLIGSPDAPRARLVVAADVDEARFAIRAQRFDLLLIDSASAPLRDWTLLREVLVARRTPMIMVVDAGRDEEMIDWLECGADDCVTRPVSPGVLLARMHAVVRRSRGREPSRPQSFAICGLSIDLAARTVALEGRPVRLTPCEFELLLALAELAGRPASREQLLELIKGPGGAEESFDRAIDIHVSRLRAKIERDPRHPRYVKTIRGRGYLLSRDG